MQNFFVGTFANSNISIIDQGNVQGIMVQKISTSASSKKFSGTSSQIVYNLLKLRICFIIDIDSF